MQMFFFELDQSESFDARSINQIPPRWKGKHLSVSSGVLALLMGIRYIARAQLQSRKQLID